MFFILAISRDGGTTWEDDFNKTYTSGQEAAKIAKDNNAYYATSRFEYNRNTRYRVRKIADTDDDNFYAREEAKSYEKLDFLEFFKDERISCWSEKWVLAHIDPDDKTMVRHFRSVTDAIEGKYSKKKLSRFLYDHYDTTEEHVTKYLIAKGFYSETHEFGITNDADEIAKVYENGPSSCMNDPDEYPLPGTHPARVYASPDLAIAFIKRGEEYTARAVICPERKLWAGIYGHYDLLASKLQKLGYKGGSFSGFKGVRLLKVYESADQDKKFPLMPYLDFASRVIEDETGEMWVANSEDEGFYTRNTDGFLDI